MGMNPTISLLTEFDFAVVDGAAVADGVAAEDGAVTAVGACHPKGTMEQLRLQVSPHHCGSNEETDLMAHQ